MTSHRPSQALFLVVLVVSFNQFSLTNHFIWDLCAISDEEELLANNLLSTWTMTFYQMAGFPLLYFVSTLELSFGRTSNLMVWAVPNGHLGLQFFILIFQPLGILKQQLYTLFMLSLPFLHLCLQGVESFVNGCRLSVSSSSRRQICHFLFLLWCLFNHSHRWCQLLVYDQQ